MLLGRSIAMFDVHPVVLRVGGRVGGRGRNVKLL